MAINTQPESEFARAVYQWVGAIPVGQVASYGQIARLAGFPRHARFVGRLMGNLPNGSRLPWWRVLRGNGELALEGKAAAEQQRRLQQEQVLVISGRVNLRRFGWQM